MERSERREEIKLKLEYFKAAASLAIVVTILVGVKQWRDANEAASIAHIQRQGTEWRDHLRLLLEKPHLRPYFEAGERLKPDTKEADAVLVMADLRIHVMDMIIDYGLSRDGLSQGWRDTFVHAFQRSPTMCQRFSETTGNYEGEIIGIAKEACGLAN